MQANSAASCIAFVYAADLSMGLVHVLKARRNDNLFVYSKRNSSRLRGRRWSQLSFPRCAVLVMLMVRRHSVMITEMEERHRASCGNETAALH